MFRLCFLNHYESISTVGKTKENYSHYYVTPLQHIDIHFHAQLLKMKPLWSSESKWTNYWENVN